MNASLNDTLSVIRGLPVHVQARLQAGEVVDRPAAVVRELVDNALDAGAQQIRVELVDGGKQAIVVEDDGIGMSMDDVPRAIEKHATSKIAAFDDLESLSTMGFRGEALFAISHAARLTIHSRHRDDPGGRAIQIEAQRGEIGLISYPTRQPGTTMTVEDLFETMPARRRTLKGSAAEFNRCKEVLVKKAMTHPHIAWTLVRDDRVVLDAPPVDEPLERMAQLWPASVVDTFVPLATRVTWGEDVVELTGFAGKPALTHSTRLYIQQFINGRPVDCPPLTGAALRAYRGLLHDGRFPALVLFWKIPSHLVDVNVHPAKREVRLVEEGRFAGLVYRAIQQCLSQHDVTPSMPSQGFEPVAAPTPTSQRSSSWYGLLKPESQSSAHQPEPRPEWVGDESPSLPDPPSPQSEWVMPTSQPSRTAPQRPVIRLPESTHSQQAGETLSGIRVLGLAFDTFVVMEQGEELILMDQHAAHERLNYEKLKARATQLGLSVQALSLPAVESLSDDEASALDDFQDALKTLGFDARRLEGLQGEITAAPAFIDPGREWAVLRPVLQKLAEGEAVQPTDLVDQALIMKACRMSIKAGDPQGPEELAHLVDELRQFDNPFACPHGRPTALRISKVELERRFHRR